MLRTMITWRLLCIMLCEDRGDLSMKSRDTVNYMVLKSTLSRQLVKVLIYIQFSRLFIFYLFTIIIQHCHSQVLDKI